MEREKTACFTGHRPEKLKRDKSEICDRLEKAVCIAIENGYDTFITGLAMGVDLWAGEIILRKKASGEKLKLIAAKPFINFEKDDKDYYHIIENADEVYIISDGIRDINDDDAYIQRDLWMVDNSSLVIAVYEGREGGTKNTIEHAIKTNVKVDYLYDRL